MNRNLNKIFMACVLNVLLVTSVNANLVYKFESGDGEAYRANYNEYGVILINRSQNKIYLGKDCDTFSQKYGNGSWGQANGGFIVTFENFSIGFPKQEIKGTIAINCSI